MTVKGTTRYLACLVTGLIAAAALAIAPASALGDSDLKLGVYLEDPYTLESLEGQVGRQFEVFLYYYTIYDHLDIDNNLWPVINGNRILLIAWEPWHRGVGNDPACNYQNILSGAYDVDIRRWAQEMKAVPGPVMFKPLSEMNYDWTCWGGTANGNTPSDFKAVWMYLRQIFDEEGANNVIWVYGPNRDWTTDDATRSFDLYYPGDEAVDFIGFSGYNWGGVYAYSWWQNFESVFSVSYDVAAARTNRPIMVSETAAPEVGGSKSQWITDMFNVLPARFPRMKVVVWFNMIQNEPDMIGETDWRIQSSPSSLLAYRTGALNLGPANMEFNYSNTCGRPGLDNQAGSAYWASYSEFLNRRMSVNYICRNNGTVNAYDVAISGSRNTNGVQMETPLPRSLGTLDAGQSASYTLKYVVPAGVQSFVTKTEAGARNFCGSVYSY